MSRVPLGQPQCGVVLLHRLASSLGPMQQERMLNDLLIDGQPPKAWLLQSNLTQHPQKKPQP